MHASKDPAVSYSAGGMVINASGLILFVQEYGYYWGLPRGRIEQGETAAEAAHREIGEEAGLRKLKLMADLGSYRRSTFGRDGQPDDRQIKDIHIFLFSTQEVELRPADPAITQAAWLKPEDAMSRLINAPDKHFFASCLSEPHVKQLLSERGRFQEV